MSGDRLGAMDIERIIAQVRKGELYKTVAAAFRISISRVSQLATAAGIERHPHWKPSDHAMTMVRNESVPQGDVPSGHRRLASGKVIRYTPPEAWHVAPPGTRCDAAGDVRSTPNRAINRSRERPATK